MILGINYSGMHDSAVALIDDRGEVVTAISEERLSRVKKDGRFPCLTLKRFDMRAVDVVAVPYLEEPPAYLQRDPMFDDVLLQTNKDLIAYAPAWKEKLLALNRPLEFFDHHVAHAYAGFHLSGRREAIALTCDYGAYNCDVTIGVYHVTPGSVERLAGASFWHYEALCSLYSDITTLLGFRPNSHEGKITGLAAHGRTTRSLEAAVWELHQSIRDAPMAMYDWIGYLDDEVPAVFEPNRTLVRRFRAELPATDADIAAATQAIYQRKLVAIARQVLDRYGTPGLPLILSGGGFANVRANMAIADVGFATTFVCPPMGDEGLAIGAGALLYDSTRPRLKAHTDIAPAPNEVTSRDVFLGDQLGAPESRRSLCGLGVSTSAGSVTPRAVADRLATGETVALFRGREEFGPRALGNRSILCGAEDVTVNARLNAQLHRTEFMPLAPALRVENFERLCGSGARRLLDTAAYMTMCFAATDEMRELCPAVVHLDGTIRPQVVTLASNAFLYKVLAEYEALTGIPAIINTSFNMHEEPIVSALEDAVAGFFAAGLDHLVVEDILVSRAENPAWERIGRLLARGTSEIERRRRVALNDALTDLLETQRDPSVNLRFVSRALIANRVPPEIGARPPPPGGRPLTAAIEGGAY